MPARPPQGFWRHAATVLPASALAVGLALVALPANAAPVASSPLAGSGTAATPATVQLNAPQRTARRVTLPARHTAAAVVDRAGLVLRRAASLAGRPYHYGSVGPRAFDCSGFTRYVFSTAVGRSLPHSSAAQYRLSHKIAKSAVRPGDLVFFVSHGHVYHVGIYAGHGLIWHAPHSGDHVRLATISTSSWVAGRVL
jgi:cell wall-associated NlpC family hydrolase